MDFDTAPLLRQLTLAEKASLTQGADVWHTAAVERLGIGSVKLADGPHGLRTRRYGADGAAAGGIEPATCFPPAVTLGSSWDVELLGRVGAALGAEARALGASVLLGPGVNIKRSPLCGRNFEYFSEDPFLSGELGLAMVDGIQSTGVGASVKHFAANNQETDRHRVSAEVDERTLHEIYLPAFERIVTAGAPWTVMCSYNKVNGTYASEHHSLLTEVLRDEWGFDGLVVSDWAAVADRVRALAAGLDLEMPPNVEQSKPQIINAVESGELPAELLDASAGRVLDLVHRAAKSRGTLDEVDLPAHHRLARHAAASSMVLLVNDGVLPLVNGDGATATKIAVIGEFARTPRYQGRGSSKVNATEVDNALDELTGQLVGAGAQVTFAPGFTLEVERTDNYADLIGEAAAAAAESEVAVFFVGLPDGAESEGYDRDHLRLPEVQIDCLQQIQRVCDKVVLVISSGGVVEPMWTDATSAVLHAWLPGQAGGGAIADVLTGRVNPSGRLTETWVHRLADHPSTLNFPGDSHRVRYGEGVFVGYRGLDALGAEVALPFGHGLSYTTFEYDDLEIEQDGTAGVDLQVTVRVRVSNTGARTGAEVVQVYVEPESPSVTRPPRELKGFTKVTLAAGESHTVQVRLDSRSFSHWDDRSHRWEVDAGGHTIAVGPNSRSLPLRARVELDGTRRPDELHAESSIDEWLADPMGRSVLQRLVGDSDGNLPGWLGDTPRRARVGNHPMKLLSVFPSAPISPAQVDQALELVREESSHRQHRKETRDGD